MADDLRDSPFLGERTINFIASIVASPSNQKGVSGSGLNAVTGFEKKLLNNQNKIRAINDELDGELLKLLKDAKDFIPPHTVMRVLLYGYGHNFFNRSYEIVYFAARDRMVLTDEEINTIVSELKKDPDTPAQWLMTLYAGDTKQEEDAAAPNNSLKLPVDFK